MEASRAGSLVGRALLTLPSLCRRRHFRHTTWDRDDIARAIEAIVDEPAFAIENGDALRVAAGRYRTRSIDLHDCLLDAIAQERHTRVLSFDRDLHNLGHAERP